MRIIHNLDGVTKMEYLSQRDPRWANVTIGETTTTLGRMGCTITCLSMLTDYFGCKLSPAQIAQNANNFSNDSVQWINLDFPTFSFRWREGHYFSDADNIIDIEVIKAYLATGNDSEQRNNRAVLLEVANRSHWVVGLYYSYGDIIAIDPWTGKTVRVLETYGNITGAALFQANTKDAWRGKGQPEAPDYN